MGRGTVTAAGRSLGGRKYDTTEPTLGKSDRRRWFIGTARFGAWWIYLTYGLIGGFGLGLAYVTPVAAVTKWFPDKRGLGSGMVVMGFGLGAFFYSNILKWIPAFKRAADEAGMVIDARKPETFASFNCSNIFASAITACLIISANPWLNSRVGSVFKTSTSSITSDGRWKAPIKFFPARVSTPVFPPIELSTIARSVVGI